MHHHSAQPYGESCLLQQLLCKPGQNIDKIVAVYSTSLGSLAPGQSRPKHHNTGQLEGQVIPWDVAFTRVFKLLSLAFCLDIRTNVQVPGRIL